MVKRMCGDGPWREQYILSDIYIKQKRVPIRNFSKHYNHSKQYSQAGECCATEFCLPSMISASNSSFWTSLRLDVDSPHEYGDMFMRLSMLLNKRLALLSQHMPITRNVLPTHSVSLQPPEDPNPTSARPSETLTRFWPPSLHPARAWFANNVITRNYWYTWFEFPGQSSLHTLPVHVQL